MTIVFFKPPKQASPIILITWEEANVNLNILFSLLFSAHPFCFTQAGTQISLADLPFSSEIFTLWYNLLPSKQMSCKKNDEGNEDSVFQTTQSLIDAIDLVSPNWSTKAWLKEIMWNVEGRGTGLFPITFTTLPPPAHPFLAASQQLKTRKKDNFQLHFRYSL